VRVSRLFNTKRLLVLLVSLILLTMLVSVTIKERESATWPEQFLVDTFSWIQNLINKPALKTAGLFEDIRKLKDVYQENEQLKESLAKYQGLQVKVNELEAENARLREALSFKEKADSYRTWVANVTGHSPNEWNSTITIDKGQKDGIQKNMAVVTTEGGLIGRVIEVESFSSKVLLITDTEKVGISALVQNGNNRAFGIVTGGSTPGTVEMSLIDRDANIQKGQKVVTSGLSDMFPKGLLIGEVTDVSFDETGLTKIAKIKPAADINHLEEVMVVERVDAPESGK
jgi:rod shape-determining protein MreC